ncbi:MAG: type II toxin-antitoxin system VapC family toxin [Deltaproteobacteria bacterium]|nr:type II toxin-antitoxin system VapC family toxin [Deltaproteobacteria bacterium]
MSYLLDTNTCSYVLKNSFAIAERLQKISPAMVHICAITIAEARTGSLKSINPSRLLHAWDYFLKPFCNRILPFDKEAAEHYGEIRADLEKQGNMIGDRDCMIAAIARCHGLILVTANTKEFQRVANLSIEDWRKI